MQDKQAIHTAPDIPLRINVTHDSGTDSEYSFAPIWVEGEHQPSEMSGPLSSPNYDADEISIKSSDESEPEDMLNVSNGYSSSLAACAAHSNWLVALSQMSALLDKCIAATKNTDLAAAPAPSMRELQKMTAQLLDTVEKLNPYTAGRLSAPISALSDDATLEDNPNIANLTKSSAVIDGLDIYTRHSDKSMDSPSSSLSSAALYSPSLSTRSAST